MIEDDNNAYFAATECGLSGSACAPATTMAISNVEVGIFKVFQVFWGCNVSGLPPSVSVPLSLCVSVCLSLAMQRVVTASLCFYPSVSLSLSLSVSLSRCNVS